MNSGLALKGSLIGPPVLRPNWRNSSERLVFTLLALGMASSLVVFVTFQQALQSQTQVDEIVNTMVLDIAKPPLYYLAHAFEITLLLSVGLIALVSTNRRTIESGYILNFTLLIGAAFLMTARGYTLPDLLSSKFADQHGPVPFLISLLVFVGARRSNWPFLSKLIAIIAVPFSLLAVIGMTGLHSFTRQEGVVRLGSILNVLYWPASWIVLRDYRQPSFVARLRFLPILIYSVGSLFTQTRLNFVMIFSLLGVYALLQRKRKRPQAPAWIIGMTLALWVVLFTFVFLRNTRAFERMENVAAAFDSRLDEDTRTGQLVAFTEDVAPHELILGKGSFGTWHWGNMLWGGADLGYLTLLFYGGLPLLLTYITTHMRPCFTVLKNSPTDLQLTAAGLVSLWCVIMCSSAYPSMDVGYYTVLFCIGACISKDCWHLDHPGRPVHIVPSAEF